MNTDQIGEDKTASGLDGVAELATRLMAAAPLGTAAESLTALVRLDPDGAADWMIQHAGRLPAVLGHGGRHVVEDVIRELTRVRRADLISRILPSVASDNWSLSSALLSELAELTAGASDSVLVPLIETELQRNATHSGLLTAAAAAAIRAERSGDAHELLTRLALADPTPATIRNVLRWRRGLEEQSNPVVRIALLSSFTVDHLAGVVDAECRALGLVPALYQAPFNSWEREAIDPGAGLRRHNADVVFLSVALDDLLPELTHASLEALRPAGLEAVDRVLQAARQIASSAASVLVVHGFYSVHPEPLGPAGVRAGEARRPWIAELNRRLTDGLNELPRAYYLDLQAIAERRQGGALDDPKMRHYARMRLTVGVTAELARAYAGYIAAARGLTRKCIVVDLDNTLWGGVVGEDGANGIRLSDTAPGVEYREFQQHLLALNNRGVLLAVNSKNNPDDALAVIRSHPEMVLRENNFATMQINWQPKPDNMRQIARDLNIGLDSLVFLDDNPNERELMRRALPEVLTPELPRDPALYRQVLERMPQLQSLVVTEEDRARATTYRAQLQRDTVRTSATTLDDYLRSLEIVVEITRDEERVLERVHQLLQRTNQFNLTTRRHSAAQLASWVRDTGWHIYSLRARDRFGDHGLTAAAVVGGGAEWQIDSLVMSCRIISYGIESALLAVIVADARAQGATSIRGEFIPSAKNAPARDFYERHGFALAGSEENTESWQMDLTAGDVTQPAWIKVERV